MNSEVMNCLRNTRSLLSGIMQRCKAPATRCYHGLATPQRLMHDLGSIRGAAHMKPLFRRQSTSPRRFVLRWYHEPRKVVASTAITLSATVMAAYDREIVPCTYRSHLVLYSHQEERDMADSIFAKKIATTFEILDPSDPRSARVRRIAEKLIHAAHRGLVIYDSNDAPILRVTEKHRKWGNKQPSTSHLRGLKWEVVLIKDDYPITGIISSGKITVNTGAFDWFKTDEEIAAMLAHEIGHVIARHSADMNTTNMFLHDYIFSRRMEIEADYIGILLLGAACFHPQWFHVMIEKLEILEKFEGPSSRCHSPKKRLQLLSEAKTMKEAMELYREVTAI